MLKDLMEDKGISVYKASKDMGIAYSTLNDLIIEKTDIKKASAELVYRLSKYLGVTMECIYENREETSKFYLYNKGRNITLEINGQRFTYLGPKNLLSFRKLNKIENNVCYITCYFFNEDKSIYEDEDYIDLYDILHDYEKEALLKAPYEIIIGPKVSSDKTRLIDDSLLVSDYMAISKIPWSSNDDVVEVVSLTRPANRLRLYLENLQIISTNMSTSLQKRAVSAVERNKDLLLDEIKEAKLNA